MAQTMPATAAMNHLQTSPNSNFVWPRNDGSIAVIHCWPVKYNDNFRASFECTDQNPDETKFAPRKIKEYRRAMRNLFGPSADAVPLIYAQRTKRNPTLVLVGGREPLLEFLRSRPDIQGAMDIVSVSDDSFVTSIKINGITKGSKRFTLTENGKSVVYIKTGFERMATVKPLYLFDTECKLGPPLVLQADVLRKLSDDGE